MHIASVGIDLGKNTFHLVALGERSKILLRKKFSRAQLLAYTANLPSSLIGLEAGAGAHGLASVLREQGHQVRLIPAQFVKPYRKSNKNDFLDAEAIAEAVTKRRICASCRSRPRSSSMCKPCIGSEIGWYSAAPP
jgi:transposase